MVSWCGLERVNATDFVGILPAALAGGARMVLKT